MRSPRAPAAARVAIGSVLVVPAAALAQGRLVAPGGLVPWALIAAYGTRDEVGLTATRTRVGFDDFRLRTASAAVGPYDRVAVAVARQRLRLGSTVPGCSIQYVTATRLFLAGPAGRNLLPGPVSVRSRTRGGRKASTGRDRRAADRPRKPPA